MKVKIIEIIIVLGICFSKNVLSQNVGVSANGATPNASSLLDIDASSLATKKGLLIPRLTLAEKTAMNPLPAAAQGLLVYQTNGVEGFYYNTSTTTTPNWVYLYSSTSGGWLTNGNAGTTASAAAYGSSATNNFIGTTDNIDFVFATNNLERMRVSGGGLVGIGTNALASNKLEVTTSNSVLNAIYGSHTSTAVASVYCGVQGALTSGSPATTGSLAYHNSSDKRYAVYGSGGDLAGAFNGYVSINPVSTGLTTNDLEIRNTVGGNPVNVIFRQTASQTTSATVLGNLLFGDNNVTTGQAQIQVTRGAASSGNTDLPTDMLFYTTADGAATLSERMRITNKGSVGIGTVPVATDFIDISPSGMTGTTQWGMYLTMPNSGTNASIGFRLDNNSASQTGNKIGIWSQVGGNDATANAKRAYYGQATGNAGTVSGARFEAIGTTGVTDNFGVYGYANGAATNNYAIYGEIGTAPATNNYAIALKDGHIKSLQTTAPTIASVTTYVLGSQSLSNATDIAGNLTIATTAAAGSITIQFNKAYAIAPIVNITPTSANSATDMTKLYITTSTTGFTLNFSASPAANTKTYNYFVIETQ